MTCACITQLEATLPNHRLDTTLILNRASNALTLATYTPLVRRDTGHRETRTTMPRLVAHTFCPFCGVRQQPEPAAPAATIAQDVAA
jgi:ribosomal protein L33